MKLRILKKWAKLRHSYGFTRRALRLEMSEGYSCKFLLQSLRFYSHYGNRNRKVFRNHTGFSKNKYYDFFFCGSRDKKDPHYNFRWDVEFDEDKNPHIINYGYYGRK